MMQLLAKGSVTTHRKQLNFLDRTFYRILDKTDAINKTV